MEDNTKELKDVSVNDLDKITVEESKELGLFKISLRNAKNEPIDEEFEEGIIMYSDEGFGELRIIAQTQNTSRLTKDENGKFKVEEWKYSRADELKDVFKHIHSVMVMFLDRYGNVYNYDKYGSLELKKIVDMVGYSRSKEKCLVFSYKNLLHKNA